MDKFWLCESYFGSFEYFLLLSCTEWEREELDEIESELKFALSPRTLVEVATVKAIMGEDGSKKN